MDDREKGLPPYIITLPSLKICTTSTKLKSLRISVIEDNTTARVPREGTVSDDMSQVITQGIASVWAIVGEVAEAAAKGTVVVHTMILGMAQGTLSTVGTFIIGTVDTKMPCGVAVETYSL